MANLNVTGSFSTSSDVLNVNYTTDAQNITKMEITKDNTNFITAYSFTDSSAVFNVSTWPNGNYSCKLRMTHIEDKIQDPLNFIQYKRLNDGAIVDTSDNAFWSTVAKYEVKANTSYSISLNHANYVCICFYDASGNFIGYAEGHTNDWSVGQLTTKFITVAGTTGILICATGDNTEITASISQTAIGSDLLLDSTGAYVIDDFSGSSVDTNKWKYELGYVRNNETQRYTNSNAQINDGILALRALKDSDGNWTSSSIISHGKFSFMYGKIVARVRACNYNGAFGAFWTLGDTFEFDYNEWGSPNTLGEWWAWCGEFDIMEYYNGNLTCGTFFNEKDESGRVYYNNYPTGDWHEFGMEWLENGTLIFTIDGHELSRTPATDNRAFHIPHYILLNQAVGAAGGTPDDWCTEIPQYVDWVKYYPASTNNVVLYTSDFSIAATDRNNNRCVVRATFNDNCINKVLSWSCDRTDLATVHSGLVVAASGSANGTVNITATSPSGVSQTIQLNIVNGVIQ